MNKVIFKVAGFVLCSVAVVSAQQEEQILPQIIPQQEQQVQQPVMPMPQVQQPLPPPPLPPPPQQQVQQPQLQPQIQQAQQTDCSKPLVPVSIGLQARFNLNGVSYGFNSKQNDQLNMGIGFGGGIVRRTPITKYLDVNPEIGFYHRNLFSEENGAELIDETEFILSVIPVLAQITPFEVPLYVAMGFQLDFPMLAKLAITEKSNEPGVEDKERTETFKDRAGYDLGVVCGIGYNVTDRFSFNFRSVIGLRSITGKSKDTRTPIQYGLGVTFF